MSTAVYWFTNDLRLSDNPGLIQANEADDTKYLYIHDAEAPHPVQGASAWWLHHSLTALEHALKKKGQTLAYYQGNPLTQLQAVHDLCAFDQLFCARAYTPYERQQQEAIYLWCQERDIEFKHFAGGLLLEPETVQNKSNQYFKVFTPFYKYYKQQTLRHPAQATDGDASFKRKQTKIPACLTLDELHLLPQHPNWAENFDRYWQPGEDGAHAALSHAIESIVSQYADSRDHMAQEGTSQLSPHLRFGELSPAQVWNEVSHALPHDASDAFLRQLVWRDFNHHLLFHRPDMPSTCFSIKFERFPWQANDDLLKRWQKGRTGYPVVDAAMRQLWQTGWMHNRARMVVASFLTKHLLISWKDGANWFWDTLVDADLGNNIGGWQWTAGCGADAAPYFRIFNPITQGERFDPKGLYTKKWLPELSELPLKYLFKPWEAPDNVLQASDITLGVDYPHPIVDHGEARKKALDAYEAVKG